MKDAVFTLGWDTKLGVLAYLDQNGYRAYVDGDRHNVVILRRR